MTITWAVTSSGHRSKQTIIGLGDNPAHARIRLTAATAALIARAGDDEWPRYTLHLGADLAAIIQTGHGVDGSPDHAATAELLARATRGSIASKALGKRAFYAQVGMDQPAAYAYAMEVMANAALTPDAQEGIAAFLEKRKPTFTERA